MKPHGLKSAKRVGGTDAEYARDVLLAALDPEDEALVERVALGIWQDMLDRRPLNNAIASGSPPDRCREQARAAIIALKRLAQGGRD